MILPQQIIFHFTCSKCDNIGHAHFFQKVAASYSLTFLHFGQCSFNLKNNLRFLLGVKHIHYRQFRKCHRVRRRTCSPMLLSLLCADCWLLEHSWCGRVRWPLYCWISFATCVLFKSLMSVFMIEVRHVSSFCAIFDKLVSGFYTN